MWRRTPTWIALGGAWLALHAGYVNAVGYLSTHRAGLTHVTGQVTRVGIELGGGSWAEAGSGLLLVSWFFLGAMLSGVLIQRTEVSEPGVRYAVAVLVEAGFLLAATLLMHAGFDWGIHLVALGAGMQNALASSYSGTVVRTTHVTGIVTDLGLLLGHALRGSRPELAQVRLLLSLALSFLAGAVLGAALLPHLRDWALLVPAGTLTVSAIGYWLRVKRS
ncbi:MAG TPA: YoaK family protein [Polyangiaceae bacterium]|nr:YoaK family protein [Polyangiaceae bacterium]